MTTMPYSRHAYRVLSIIHERMCMHIHMYMLIHIDIYIYIYIYIRMTKLQWKNHVQHVVASDYVRYLYMYEFMHACIYMCMNAWMYVSLFAGKCCWRFGVSIVIDSNNIQKTRFMRVPPYIYIYIYIYIYAFIYV